MLDRLRANLPLKEEGINEETVKLGQPRRLTSSVQMGTRRDASFKKKEKKKFQRGGKKLLEYLKLIAPQRLPWKQFCILDCRCWM